MKAIAYISSGILIIFGFLFVLGAFSPQGQIGWLITGSILFIIGFGILFLGTRIRSSELSKNNNNTTTLKIELPADVDIERFQCQNCGSNLSMENVKLVAGAPMVECPYCDAAYQLTEKPKW